MSAPPAGESTQLGQGARVRVASMGAALFAFSIGWGGRGGLAGCARAPRHTSRPTLASCFGLRPLGIDSPASEVTSALASSAPAQQALAWSPIARAASRTHRWPLGARSLQPAFPSRPPFRALRSARRRLSGRERHHSTNALSSVRTTSRPTSRPACAPSLRMSSRRLTACPTAAQARRCRAAAACRHRHRTTAPPARTPSPRAASFA